MSESQNSNNKIIDAPSATEPVELRAPKSHADFEELSKKIDAIQNQYSDKIKRLETMKPSLEEQMSAWPKTEIQRYKRFIKKHSGATMMDNLILDFYKIAEDVPNRVGPKEDPLPEDIIAVEKIINKINALNQEVDKFLSMTTLERVPKKEGIETFEQYNFKKIDEEIGALKNKTESLKESLDKIMSSGYQEAFDEKFTKRLIEFSHFIGYAEGELRILEEESKRVALKLEQSHLTDEEITSEFNRLLAITKRIEENILKREGQIKRIGKNLESEKSEQEPLRNRLFVLKEKLLKKVEKPFFAVKDGKKLSLKMIEEIDKMTGRALTKKEVDEITEAAEKNIFEPEIKSDQKDAKMRFVFENLPSINEGKEELEKMTTELLSFSSRIKGKDRLKDSLEGVQSAVSTAFIRNDAIKKMLDPKDKTPIEQIQENIEEYKKDFSLAREKFEELLPDLVNASKKEMEIDLDFALSSVNQKYLPKDKKTMLEGVRTIIKKDTGVTLEEIDELNSSVKAVIAIIAQNRKAEMDQESQERGFFRKGAEASQEIEEKYSRVPERKVIPEKPASMPDIQEVEKSLPLVSKKEVQSSIAEMLAREGIIEINPDVLLSFFSETEINNLVDSVKKDVLANSNKNREDFNVIFKEVLGDKILNKLEQSKREQMTEVITEQVYSLLRGAVEAESQKEIAVLHAGKASKMGKIGSFAARMAPQLAMAAGIGIGAGLVIGSGGAAAAVAGASIGLVRMLNKKIAKSEIFQKAKEKAGSFWGKTVGRLFKKEKPPVDNEKVIAETADKYINKEILASILSNQLRENSSQDLIEQVQVFAEDKNKAMRNPSPELIEKFSASLEETSREFYKNSYNYLLARYPDVSEEKIAKMATYMALNLKMYQRNEILSAESLVKADEKVKDIEDKGWLVDKMEKFFKFRSEGAGAVLFGGALGYAIAETSTAGRVASGALAGAGLGLMIERKTRMAEDEKLKKIIEKMIDESEKKLFGKEIIVAEKDFEKAKNDSAYIRAKLDMGLFDNNLLLKNRVENFIARINKMTLEKYESADDLLADIKKQNKKYDKETQKTAKKILKSFDTKNRALVYMGVGAVVGGLAGYAGARLADYLRAPEGETIVSAEKGFIGGAVYPAEQLTPPETPLTPIPPETPLTPIPPETPLKPIEMESDAESEHVFETEPTVARKSVLEQLRSVKTTRPSVETIPAVSDDEGVLNVHQVYSAGIRDLRLHGMEAGEPVYLTKDEAFQINKLMNEDKVEEAMKLIKNNIERGPIYEDLSTGKQYHADELDFNAEELPSVEKPKPSLYEEEEVYGARPKLDIKNPYDEDMPEPRVRPEAPRPRLNIENPYDESVMTPEQNNTMIEIHNKTGANMAERYRNYIETGEMERANAVLELANTIGPEDPVQPIHIETETPEPAPIAETEIANEQAGEEEQIAEEEMAEEESETETEEETIGRQAKEIIASREQSLVNELKGANAVKARESYSWLMENQDNPKAIELKKDFVKDMLDDNKIKPSLLKKITILRESI